MDKDLFSWEKKNPHHWIKQIKVISFRNLQYIFEDFFLNCFYELNTFLRGKKRLGINISNHLAQRSNNMKKLWCNSNLEDHGYIISVHHSHVESSTIPANLLDSSILTGLWKYSWSVPRTCWLLRSLQSSVCPLHSWRSRWRNLWPRRWRLVLQSSQHRWPKIKII